MALVTVSTLQSINFAPSSLIEEITQNVRTIISTVKGSVPLDREFGVDFRALDTPTPAAMMQWRIRIIQAISKYEPRCRVKSVDFEQDENNAEDGVLLPVVTLEILNG